jgi:hypothetical protein
MQLKEWLSDFHRPSEEFMLEEMENFIGGEVQ